MPKVIKNSRPPEQKRHGLVKIKMLGNSKGSDCNDLGQHDPVKLYEEDAIYEVGPSLAKAFVEDLKVAKKAVLGKAEKKSDSAKPSSKSSKRSG